MKKNVTGRLLIAAVVLVPLALAAPREARGEYPSCTMTAVAARAACFHERQDDYFIALGKCDNLLSMADRRPCRQRAEADRREAAAECRLQFQSRTGICAELGQAAYDPVIDPANFMTPAGTAADPNPYFPLVPGTVYTYEGGTETVTVTVTGEVKVILGVACIAVHDVVADAGEVIEDTWDWYAQDLDGNVWYFGEISQEFVDGELVSIDGSWKAGVDGAKPGIIMQAAPEVGDFYRQEFLLGDAEDVAQVVSVTGTAVVPAATCSGDCVVTSDFTPLEPDVAERKFYAPGVGLILEVDVETGDRVELVSVTP